MTWGAFAWTGVALSPSLGGLTTEKTRHAVGIEVVSKDSQRDRNTIYIAPYYPPVFFGHVSGAPGSQRIGAELALGSWCCAS